MKKLIALLALAFLLPALGHAATFEAILVVASRRPGKSDPRLAPYEANLKRLLRFESFRQAGQGSAKIDVPGTGRIKLGEGQSLEVETSAPTDSGIRARARWIHGSKLLMDTGLVFRPGVPAVLGGPSKGDNEVYAVILIAK